MWKAKAQACSYIKRARQKSDNNKTSKIPIKLRLVLILNSMEYPHHYNN